MHRYKNTHQTYLGGCLPSSTSLCKVSHCWWQTLRCFKLTAPPGQLALLHCIVNRALAKVSIRAAMAQTAVVTGATGFVATELVKQLLAKVGTAAAVSFVIAHAADVDPYRLNLRYVMQHTGLQCQGNGALDQGLRQDTGADKPGSRPAWCTIMHAACLLTVSIVACICPKSSNLGATQLCCWKIQVDWSCLRRTC